MPKGAGKPSQLTIAQWFIQPGKLTIPGHPAARIEHVPPDNRTVHIQLSHSGKVWKTAATAENRLSSGEYKIPDGALFTFKTYANSTSIDPFQELREACSDLARKPSRIASALNAAIRWLLRIPTNGKITQRDVAILIIGTFGLIVLFAVVISAASGH
jgi:hypothetical protein